MKLNIAATTLLLLSFRSVTGQQAGSMEQEGNPTITLKECTLSSGCTSSQAKLTLDANWRWIHSTSGFDNCYTGNQWNSQFCSDPIQCAQNCALEGVSKETYESTYGVQQIQDGVKVKFVTQHEHGVNVGSRLYVMDDNDNYKLFHLKNREFSFEVDVSELQCGMNGAMYFSEMAADGGKGLGMNNAGAKYGTGYCDAQCPHDIKFISGEANVIDWIPNLNDFSNNMGMGKYGSCCAEMDIWEANSMATAYTPHTCGITGQFKCDGIDCGDNDKGERYDGVCDKDGCDINPYRMGNPNFYGRDPENALNTLKPMTVVTQFLTTDGTDNGDLSEIRRFYVQDGNIIHSPPSTILGPSDTDSITDAFCDAKKDLFGDEKDYQEHGGMKGMGESLDRGHVMIFSLWDDVEVNMLWLDSAFPLDRPESDPGVKRGECPGGISSTPEYLRDTYPDGYVTFKNAAVGEIGSTLLAPPPTPPTMVPSPTPQGNGCCSWNNVECQQPDNTWCQANQNNCEGPCNGTWLTFNPPTNPPTKVPTIPPTGTTTTPTTLSPTITPATDDFLSCSTNSMSSLDAFAHMDSLTYEVSTNPYTLTILAEGGAAGSGGSVVSEGQGYGIMTAAITLASLDSSDPNRDYVLEKFYGYFNGWKQMCINSSSSAFCQSPFYCNGGSAPCLPGWKHTGDLSSVVGTGAAPDGDEDAIVGMIIALKAVEGDNPRPEWYDEVHQWTDQSCTQFLKDNTILSSSSSHRLLKLGSCWGGFDASGNNPSYPSPGAFRAMRDFHVSYDGPRAYSMPSFGDNLPLEDKWNMLIDTTYKFYSTTQCTDTGLVPNWALVQEVDTQTLDKYPGSFSGSGTPQYEFGAEASRTMWRVAFDAILYPEEASVQSREFLAPIHLKLRDGFDANLSKYWHDSTLATCTYVHNVFNDWRNNGFIYSPVYSTLAVQAESLSPIEQQSLVNAACSLVGDIEQSYYARSWQVIGMMTLNGDVKKVGDLLRGNVDTVAPTIVPTTLAPITPVTLTPTNAPTVAVTSPPTKSPTVAHGCFSNDYKHCLPDDYTSEVEVSCNNIWLPTGAQNNCVALWGECTKNTSSCCGPAECFGDNDYASCIPLSGSLTPTEAPTTPPTSSPCIVCDDVETPWMTNNGKDCTTSGLINTKCNKNSFWTTSKFCRHSCYHAGYGYPGDVCCEDTTVSRARRILRTFS